MQYQEVKTGLGIQSKQEYLKKDIRKSILNGEYPNRLPGLKELATKYDVNIKTIRKSLESLRKEGILVPHQGKGIFICRDNQHRIGIVGKSQAQVFFSGRYYLEITQKILAMIEERKDSFSYQQKKEENAYNELFRNGTGVDGILTFVPFGKEKKDLLRLPIPFLIIGATYEKERFNYVDSDNLEDSRKAVEYLIRRGHQKIVFICCCVPGAPAYVLRLAGYRKALKENGVGFDRRLVIIADSEKVDFRKKIEEVFKLSSGKPTAIFGANSFETAKTLEILGERRKEIAVIAYDDFEQEISIFGCEGGVILQPLEEIGRLATESLYGLIEGTVKGPVQIKLRATLRIKGKAG